MKCSLFSHIYPHTRQVLLCSILWGLLSLGRVSSGPQVGGSCEPYFPDDKRTAGTGGQVKLGKSFARFPQEGLKPEDIVKWPHPQEKAGVADGEGSQLSIWHWGLKRRCLEPNTWSLLSILGTLVNEGCLSYLLLCPKPFMATPCISECASGPHLSTSWHLVHAGDIFPSSHQILNCSNGPFHFTHQDAALPEL